MKLNNEQIGFIQEDILLKNDKIYLNGFKVYISCATERRKGVIIFVDNKLKMKVIKVEEDENNGRYLKDKITSNISQEAIC